MVIIDALRYDFTVPIDGQPQHFQNAITILHELAVKEPHNAFLLPFIADPPTTTLQRLKGLTTGTLPTFVDAGSNFAGTAIEEDNIISQLRDANKTMVHLGDDTWHALFPGYFDSSLTHAYESLNVWDLHTVDNGVTEHLLPLMRPENVERWDVIFGHYLGVDHAGHRYGPDHPAMTAKLRQMDNVLREVVEALDDQTLLVIMGDHGMDAKGDHGGESDDEIEAALWMYSKKGVFGRSHPDFMYPPKTAKQRPVEQIDLVPTLSLLLGIPIPFNNLGAPIEEAFIGPSGRQWLQTLYANTLTGAQIREYQHEYAVVRGLDESVTSETHRLWQRAMELSKDAPMAGKSSNDSVLRSINSAFSNYQKETLRVCRSLWARFDIPNMLQGIAVLLLTVVILVHFARFSAENRSETVPSTLRYIAVGTMVGLLLGGIVCSALPDCSIFDISLLGFAIGGLFGYISYLSQKTIDVVSMLPNSVWGGLCLCFTVSQSAGFASNSFTIWEDEILLFFLGSFVTLAVLSSLRQINLVDRTLGIYHSLIFSLLTRVVSLSRLCREEQMPSCKSTFYSSTSSSTSAIWQLSIPYITAAILPAVIKSYYQGTKSYEGPAVLSIGFILRTGLSGSALYWTLNAADDGDWFPDNSGTITSVRITLAQLVLAVAFAIGTPTFIWASPCVRIETTSRPAQEVKGSTGSTIKSATVWGYANAHGSRYFLLYSMWLLTIVLVQKPMGSGSLAILTWQVLSCLEIIDANNLSQSAIGPIVLGLLGNFHFFKTGHQATLASIQWDSAFVALRTIRYPWSPFLVLLNTFGAQILAAIAVPLVVLWKQPPKKKGLLNDVAKAMATHLSYYAVINVATMMWAGWLRRHLMLYRIFSPRFMTGAAVLVVVDLFGVLVALAGVRWNTLSVAEVFGWE